MDHAASVERWNHTAQLLAMIHNASGRYKDDMEPWQFHHHIKSKKGPKRDIPMVPITALKMFVH